MARFTLKSAQFRREREESWQQLEAILAKAERGGIRGLSEDELTRLPSLYRGAVSALSVARSISLDRNLLDYLTNLTSRAYVVVYAAKRRPAVAVADFLFRALPSAVRVYGIFLLVAIACMGAGALSSYLLTLNDLERYYDFVPDHVAQGRTPAATTEQLREELYSGGESEAAALQLFATFLFTHNAKVGMLCCALGFAAGAPTIVLLFYNGLVLGAMAALHRARGLEADFWAWVLPHGVTELLAVALCGAAGLVFGMALVFPGAHTRLENLALRGRRAALLVLGAVGLFFIAALIEGLFRQLVQSLYLRWSVVILTLGLWIFYFGFVGRQRADQG